ncbi:SWIB/MDM2 domain superfamily protein [Artemisia annua]|uniref:SWIB/MDM2 domain superfamily protein n=1 Tax=Artemisia annua TaxID=35608 RepID=A0A2U1KP58_ARTAN|nr:SWIB/MDM2 domain superfamily protein [Artemisia annua]
MKSSKNITGILWAGHELRGGVHVIGGGSNLAYTCDSMIKLSVNSPSLNACYDVLVDVPFPVQRELNALLATTEKAKDIEACDEAICTFIRKINEHRKRRALFLGFSQSPVTNSQKMNKRRKLRMETILIQKCPEILIFEKTDNVATQNRNCFVTGHLKQWKMKMRSMHHRLYGQISVTDGSHLIILIRFQSQIVHRCIIGYMVRFQSQIIKSYFSNRFDINWSIAYYAAPEYMATGDDDDSTTLSEKGATEKNENEVWGSGFIAQDITFLNKQWCFFPALTNQLFTIAALRAKKTHFLPLCVHNFSKNANYMELLIYIFLGRPMECQHPIIMAVSSCLAKRYGGSIQLSGTPGTSYYLNPEIPEAAHIRAVYSEMLGPVMSMALPPREKKPHEELTSQEVVNVWALLEINPDTLPLHQKFTTEAVIVKIDEEMERYMNWCKTCNKKIEETRPHWQCQEPGTALMPNYIYCFKSIIADVTGSAMLTWFSPEAHSLLPVCAEVLSYVPDPNQYELPPIIKNLQNTKHRFQVHFGDGSRKGTPRLVLNHVSDARTPLFPQIEGVESSNLTGSEGDRFTEVAVVPICVRVCVSRNLDLQTMIKQR